MAAGSSPRESKRKAIFEDEIWLALVRGCKMLLMTTVTNEAIKLLSLANERWSLPSCGDQDRGMSNSLCQASVRYDERGETIK